MDRAGIARSPGMQRREVMAAKRTFARKLLADGLTVTQIAGQLACSRTFVRQVRQELEREAEVQRAG